MKKKIKIMLKINRSKMVKKLLEIILKKKIMVKNIKKLMIYRNRIKKKKR